MNVEEIRAYCLSKPGATEDFPFDETTLVFRVEHKIFACIGLDNVDWFCLKCDPDYAIELRERYRRSVGGRVGRAERHGGLLHGHRLETAA